MTNFADLQRDSGDLGELVNENKLVATRYGGNKKSWQYLVDQFEAEFAQTLLEINKSRGYRVVGTFAAGFDYELFNDVGVDASGNGWIYVGSGAPVKTVTAGTVPSAPDYQQVTYNSIDGVVGLRDELNDRALYLTLAEVQAKTDLVAGQHVRLIDRDLGLFVVRAVGLVSNGNDIIGINGGRSLEYVIENSEIHLNHLGAVADGVFDSTGAMNAAISLSYRNNNCKIKLGVGTYKITDTISVGKGIPIEGMSNSATIGVGTTIKHYHNSSLFWYDGSAVSGAQNTGGGVSNMLIVKASGFTGGNAIIVYYPTLDGDTNARASTYNFSEITITAENTGSWERGLLVDGLQFNTSGSRGIRNVSVYKLRVAGCSLDYQSVLLRQVTHFTADLIQTDQGNGSGLAGITIEGYNENVNLSNMIVNGRLAMSGTNVSFGFDGKLSELSNTDAAATGCMSITSSCNIVAQSSTGLRIDGSGGSDRRSYKAGTLSGFSDDVFSTYSGSDQLLKVGHISAAIQTLKPLKNDGQLWMYANAFDYETSGNQSHVKVEYTRFRHSGDGTASLGFTSNRWSDVYAVNGTINTSDEREKQQIQELTPELLAVARRIMSLNKTYKWNSSVEEKGGDARTHIGLIAQDVIAAFEAEGLNAFEYGAVCYDEWEDEYETVPAQLGEDGDIVEEERVVLRVKAGNRYGLRFQQLNELRFAYINSVLSSL